MRSIEFTAYAVREYDVKYTAILDENDPLIQEMLINNDMTFDDLSNMTFADYQGLFDNLMAIPTQDIDIDEDFAPAEERYIDFATCIMEN